MTDQDIQRYIENYIRGKLSESEEDELWKEFLREPKWYDYFTTELNLWAITCKKG